LLVNSDDSVEFLTPIKGSKYAYLVNNLLEINFSVIKDSTTHLTPEVVSAKNATPQDFGYTTFGFSEVNTFELLLSVEKIYQSGITLTDASIRITNLNDTTKAAYTGTIGQPHA
jgi:hypothetical protein